MDIKDLIKMQSDFDDEFKFLHHWKEKVSESNLDVLAFLLISIQGELGEASNLFKKVLRGDYNFSDIKDDLKIEIVDIFIYILKLINQLDIDIEKEYIKKKEKNQIKFNGLK